MITENVSTLRIHQLSNEQFKREKEADRLEENAFYITPEEEGVVVPELDDEGILHFTSVDSEGQSFSSSAVCYTEQDLTDKQKARARENIGAVSDEIIVTSLEETTITWDGDPTGLVEGYEAYKDYTDYYVRISDFLPPVGYKLGDVRIELPELSISLPEDSFVTGEPLLSLNGGVNLVYAPISTYTEHSYISFPEPGLYVLAVGVSVSITFPAAKCIASHLLPHEPFVKYTEQTLTENQKACARENIGACKDDVVVTVAKYHITLDEYSIIKDIETGMGGGWRLMTHTLPSIEDLMEYGLDSVVTNGRHRIESHFAYSELVWLSDGVVGTNRFGGDCVIVFESGVGVSVPAGDSGASLQFADAGIYFSYGLNNNDDVIKTISISTGPQVQSINKGLLQNSLPSSILTAQPQNLTTAQRARVRKNIGVDSLASFSDSVFFDGSTLGKYVANVGPGSFTPSHYVRVSANVPTVADFPTDLDDITVHMMGTEYVESELSIKELSVEKSGVIIPDCGVDPAMFVSVPKTAVGSTVEIYGAETVFPAKGFYVAYFDDGNYVSSVTLPTFDFAEELDDSLVPYTIMHSKEQNLSEAQKAQARKNIGAAAIGEGSGTASTEAVLYTEQTLTEEQKAQARKNIGTDFSYDFATVNKTSTKESDYNALKYVETNWSKEPMNISVQGFPVVKVDITNKRFCTFYTDKAMHVFKWETDDTAKSSKVTWVSKQTLVDTSYVDTKVEELADELKETSGNILKCEIKDTHVIDSSLSQLYKYSDAVLTPLDIVDKAVTAVVKHEDKEYVASIDDYEAKDDGFIQIDLIYRFSETTSYIVSVYYIPYDNYEYDNPFFGTTTIPTRGIWSECELISITIPGFSFPLGGTIATRLYVDDQIGRIESVLDSIISIQESLIGGESV